MSRRVSERNTALSEEDIRMRMNDLHEGRMRAPDSSSPAFRRAHVLPSAEAARAPGVSRDSHDEDPSKMGDAFVPSGTTKHEPTNADNALSAGDPRLAELRVRHPTVRSSVAFPEDALEAADLPADEVRARLAQLNDYVAQRVQAGELPCIDLPDLHQVNSIDDPRGNVFLGHNVRRLSFDRNGGKPFMRLLLALETASENRRTESASPSGAFTTSNGRSSTTRGRTRPTPIVRSRRWRTSWASGGRRSASSNRAGARSTAASSSETEERSWTYRRWGAGGHAVPRFTDDVEILSSDATFILIVEKLAVAFRLAQARFWDAARCIIVCGEGYPSLSMREFVRTLVDTLGIPALICVDGDPAGIRLALTYAHGSIRRRSKRHGWLAITFGGRGSIRLTSIVIVEEATRFASKTPTMRPRVCCSSTRRRRTSTSVSAMRSRSSSTGG